MKRRHIILLAATVTAGVGIGVSVISHSTDSQARVEGYLRAEDVPQIQRAVRRDRWLVAKSCLATRHFKLFFGLCVPDTAFGRVREIGSIPDRAFIGFGTSVTNPSSRAYVLSGGWYSRRSVKYALERTTNGWEVTSFGFQ